LITFVDGKVLKKIKKKKKSFILEKFKIKVLYFLYPTLRC